MKFELHRPFKKKFKKFSSKMREKFFVRVDMFLFNPFHPLLNDHELVGKYDGYRSINITGDFRAIYKFADKDTIVFYDLDNHHNLYGK